MFWTDVGNEAGPRTQLPPRLRTGRAGAVVRVKPPRGQYIEDFESNLYARPVSAVFRWHRRKA